MSISDLAFVLDAHEQQPLMPVAATYARELLRNGEASLWPHPTFTIIRLAPGVEQPVQRPVLIGIAVHRRTVELFVVAEGTQQALPLLYIVVDVSAKRRHWQQQRRSRHRRRAGGRAGGLMLDVRAMIGEFWRLLPLSHIVIVQTNTLKCDYPGLARLFSQYLASDDFQIAIGQLDSPAPIGVPPSLFQALVDFTAHPPAHAPLVVAMPMAPLDHETRLRYMMIRHDKQLNVPGIGLMNGLMGVLGANFDGTDDIRFHLRLPVAANRAGVRWVRMQVASTEQLQSWPPGTAAFLPLASLEGRADVEVMEDVIEDRSR